jgi:NADPH:quinone reductase-like Zn-dependent oxidoreductase
MSRAAMRALIVDRDRQLRVVAMARPAPLQATDVVVRIAWVSLNRLDLFASSGMLFAQQSLPMIAGVEGSGVVAQIGDEVRTFRVGDRVAVFPGTICGSCRACTQGRENVCSGGARIRGFNADGVGAEFVVVPAGQLLAVPAEVTLRDAACVPVTAATVEHMLCENAQLQAGETVLIQAGGSGIGSVAIRLAKHLGATVITTVGSAAKADKARSLGADHVIDYSHENFSRVVRRLTAGRGVDVVFEHVGASTWDGSLRSLDLGGRLVICGSHTGTYAKTNLLHLFNRQVRIFASFGGNYRNIRSCFDRLASGAIHIPIDAELDLSEASSGLSRLRDRNVFGKLVLRISAEPASRREGSYPDTGSVTRQP